MSQNKSFQAAATKDQEKLWIFSWKKQIITPDYFFESAMYFWSLNSSDPSSVSIMEQHRRNPFAWTESIHSFNDRIIWKIYGVEQTGYVKGKVTLALSPMGFQMVPDE